MSVSVTTMMTANELLERAIELSLEMFGKRSCNVRVGQYYFVKFKHSLTF